MPSGEREFFRQRTAMADAPRAADQCPGCRPDNDLARVERRRGGDAFDVYQRRQAEGQRMTRCVACGLPRWPDELLPPTPADEVHP